MEAKFVDNDSYLLDNVLYYCQNSYGKKDKNGFLASGFPSKKASDLLGIKLYENWKIPEPFDINKIFSLCLFIYWDEKIKFKEKFSILNYVYDKIIKLNPILANINVNSSISLEIYQKKYELLQGVCSKFNYDDIKFFVELPNSAKWQFIYNTNKAYKILFDETEKKSNVKFHWVVSFKTLNKIIKSL
jgi:hypothetical protein